MASMTYEFKLNTELKKSKILKEIIIENGRGEIQRTNKRVIVWTHKLSISRTVVIK